MAMALAVVVPAVLSAIGLLPRMVTLTPSGGILIESPIFAFHHDGAFVVLLVVHVLLVIFSGGVMGRFFDRLRHVEARAVIQSWYLRQLLPKAETKGA
jgi:hypothetical protein